MIDSKIELGKLGFYWRMTEKPNVPKNLVPDFVDFSFDFIEDYQLIIQTRSVETWKYLKTIYKENYNVGYLQEGHDLAASYGNDFLEYIDFAMRKFNSSIKTVCEIGAGGCYILNRLKKKGMNVTAIDPSPIAINKGKEFSIEIIPDFYPPKHPVSKSDMIIHYDVLEHVVNPSEFLKHHITDLNPNGLILFAVPDCTSYINSGDISMVLHEHLNYYDSDSLRYVVESAGFDVLNIDKAKYGGVLYCVATPSHQTKWIPRVGRDKFVSFSQKHHKLKSQVLQFIAEGTKEGNTLGCYIPLRIIPYLSMIDNKKNIRFFDDNGGIYGQYFDGFAIPVENRNDLIANPVTHLLVMSSAFGEKIKNDVKLKLNIKIVTLNDLVL